MKISLFILCLFIGYMFGNFQTSYLLGKLKGIDITKVGSGNAGTTNALRSMGKKAGAVVFACDILKCVLAIILVRLILSDGDAALGRTLGLVTGMGCILGHNYPFLMHFKGGKGIACSFAVVLMYNWKAALIAFALFIILVYITDYVSLGSIAGVCISALMMCIMTIKNVYHLSSSQQILTLVLWLVMAGMALYRHRANIVRLMSHTENKTYLFKKKR